jgi:hypothetical protein
MNGLVKQKDIFEMMLINIFTKYSIKFASQVYENTDSLRQFQKKLYKIPNWSFDKKDKEYKLFLKYVLKKYDKTEKNLTDILENTYISHIKIISSVFNYIDIQIPTLNDFWYRIMKKIGKIFYENPRFIIEDLNYSIIKNAIKYTIQKYIPLKNIIHSKKEFETEPLYYNFSEEDRISEIDKKLLNEQLLMEIKDLSSISDDDNKLKYISPEQFENDYYHSEYSSEHINIDELDLKYIKLKK